MNQLALVTDSVKAQVSFTVPGVPVAKGRGRATTIGGRARIFTPTKTRDYESWVAQHARQAMGATPRFTGALELIVHAFLPVPQSWSKKRKAGARWHATRPDLDNLVKSVLDGINGIVFEDDGAIAMLHASKEYDDVPRVVVTVLGRA